MLHLNVKDCRVNDAGADSGISIAVGRKFDRPLTDAYHVDFVYRVAASKPGYMQVLLSAAAGPLGTKNYRVVVEATPLSAQSTFMHMTYAYSYGAPAQAAMQSYLATIGRNKIGFSIIDRKSDGAPFT